jgi:hypothetical protein
MNKRFFMFMTVFVLFAGTTRSQETPPLKLVQTLQLPAGVKGNFDHFGVDLKGNRLFATPEDYKAVLVFDLKTGKPIHTIGGIGRPHAVLYREDLNRIYITDGNAGDVKIFDGTTYNLLSSVKLLEDSDSIGYDTARSPWLIPKRGRKLPVCRLQKAWTISLTTQRANVFMPLAMATWMYMSSPVPTTTNYLEKFPRDPWGGRRALCLN